MLTAFQKTLKLLPHAALVIMASAAFLYADDMPGMHMNGMYGTYSMSREGSGTAWQPESTPHDGVHEMVGEWMLMFHGYFDQITDHQGGPRGDDKNFSASMFMTMAQRQLGPGTFGFRNMLSLEPSMGKRGYPELLQTGETADGQSHLTDRQHPHDLFMELAVTYSVPLAEKNSAFVYLGLPGEPALGPGAFMHRFSGMDNPEAPISHHWLDSTHITFGVTTLGFTFDKFKIEGSAFKGREPDQHRWDIESPKLDSYSGRLTVNPTEDWSAQISYGDIHSPEQLEPELNQQRTTASVSYNRAMEEDSNWQTTAAWGQNVTNGHSTNAYLLESAFVLRKTHTFFGRTENVEKNELFSESDTRAGTVYRVSKISVGYIYDFLHLAYGQIGIGGLGSIYALPNSLDSVYGKNPTSYMLFLRAKLG